MRAELRMTACRTAIRHHRTRLAHLNSHGGRATYRQRHGQVVALSNTRCHRSRDTFYCCIAA